MKNYLDIKTKIIPFFQEHSLLFESKRVAFERFVDIAQRFEAKQHLTEEGFEEMKTLAKAVHGRIPRDYTPIPVTHRSVSGEDIVRSP